MGQCEVTFNIRIKEQLGFYNYLNVLGFWIDIGFSLSGYLITQHHVQKFLNSDKKIDDFIKNHVF